MNGVTGRMGTNQHLMRSILAIREQGGVRRRRRRHHPGPDPRRAQRGQAGGARRAAGGRPVHDRPRRGAGRPGQPVYFDAHDRPPRARRAPGHRRRQGRLLREADRDDTAEALALYQRVQAAGREERRRPGQALAAGPAQAEAPRSTRASSAGSSPCAANSATGSSRATAARPAPLVELPQGGRRRHHRRHALPLALRHRQPLRRGGAVSCLGRDPHPGALGRAGRPYACTPTTPPTPRSNWTKASSASSTARGARACGATTC